MRREEKEKGEEGERARERAYVVFNSLFDGGDAQHNDKGRDTHLHKGTDRRTEKQSERRGAEKREKERREGQTDPGSFRRDGKEGENGDD
jgi:hypothetical protein